MEIDGQEITTQTYNRDWALALMTQGVIVNLTIAFWRANGPLNYDELGIVFKDKESKDFMKRYVRLGTEKLLPQQVISDIASIEFKARQCLNSYSFNTIWGKFVPYSAFPEWKKKNEKIKEEFLNLAVQLGNKYDEILEEVKTEYKKMGRDVWFRLYPNDKKEPPESFLENFTSKIINKIPPREKIVASFKYDMIYLVIPMPSLIEEDISKSEKIRLDREKDFISHNLELETKRLIAEDYRKRKTELIDGFLEATVHEVRHYISRFCDDIALAIRNNDREVNKPQIKRIRKMIDQFRNLNFYNDKDIDDLLTELDQEVCKFKGERDKAIITAKLQQLIDVATEEFDQEHFMPTISFID